MSAAAGDGSESSYTAAAAPVAPPVLDTAPDVSTRVVAGNFRYFEEVYGRERLQSAVAEIGGPSLEYILDPENFVSLEYLVRVARVLTDASGDPYFLRTSGMYQFKDPRALGFVFHLVRSLGSPELYYRLAVKAAKTFNRVCEMTIEDVNDHHLRLRYRSLRSEGTRLICEGRMGQLAGAPTLWGLPPAAARELECQVNGAPACLYEFDWTPPFRPGPRAVVAGVVGGLVGGLVHGVWGAVAGAVAATLAALAWMYRRDAQEKSRRLLDGATAGTRSMEELGRRFEDVQRLANEAQMANQALRVEMQRREGAEAALIEAQKLEAVGRLSGGIAHDFNNILTVIMGSAQHAEALSGAPPPVVEDLRIITEASERAAELTRGLLAFARRQVVEPRVLRLDEQARRLERLLAPLVGEAVHMEFALAPEPLQVLMDPGQLEQVLLNLAANARDAMPDGGTLRIETRAVTLSAGEAALGGRLPPGAYVLLRVSDTGQGMDEMTRAHLFEPFFTTKELGRGTGLGLATCHGIITQANGSITVDTVLGSGTTFNVYLPRASGPADASATQVRPAANGGSETVLVVEDDALVRQLVARTLSDAGYRVLSAGGGEAALGVAAAETGQIHLLVTDVIMPGLDGRMVAEQLRRQRSGLGVLFISGYSREVLSRRGALDPGLNLLPKPFSAEQLLARVRGILDAGQPVRSA